MRYVPHVDPRSLDLRDWARWTADGQPLHFSTYGNSTSGKPFMPHPRKTYQTCKPLWHEAEGDGAEFTDRVMRIDRVLHGALTDAERRLLLVATVPSPNGAPMPLADRAAAVGVAPEALRLVRRRALELIG